MADKTPVRVVFNSDNVATGMAEFQSGETVAVTHGGTGLSSIGSAGQIIKVNAAGTALEFGAEGDLSITNLVAPTNADLTFSTSGTGNLVLDQVTLRGTTFSSTDSSSININEGLIVDGTLSVSGSTSLAGLTYPTSDGSSGQVLQTNGSGTLSFASVSLGDLSIIGSSIASPSNADLTLDPAGTGAIKLNANTDITGAATITTTTTDDSLLITTTEASNSAAPVFTLKRNSGSPADADYLGRIKFKGENDADQEVQYASISGKILDASDGTEDGAIEFNVKKAGSNNIAARLNSDEFKLLNSTTLDVDGSGTFSTDVSVGDDLTLVSDGAILSFGANSEIALTHVHDTGLLLTDSGGTPTLQLHDANESIASDGSKVIITSGGTTFNFPTADGSAGQALVTDGSGTLSFDTVSTTISDDTLAQVRNNKHMGTQARSIDSINATLIDSAFYFLVYNDVLNEVISAECLSITNNDSASFLGNRRGINSVSGSNVPTLTTDVTNGQFRLRAAGSSADCLASFYKIPFSSSTTDATRGNTVTTSNTDVDSASESIDTFAHADYRGAKYFISVDNDSKTEMDVVEAIVVHDGSDAFIMSYGHNSSNGDSLITLTAAISGSNVVVSAAGLETNLNLTIHKILLKDNMTASSNANQKAFASVTVSSSATAIDLMDLDEGNGAVYFIVGANSSEGAYSIQEVYTAATPGLPTVAIGPYVSTKGTQQLEFTAEFDTATENSLELFASSTSGGGTTVSGYRISALAG